MKCLEKKSWQLWVLQKFPKGDTEYEIQKRSNNWTLSKFKTLALQKALTRQATDQ